MLEKWINGPAFTWFTSNINYPDEIARTINFDLTVENEGAAPAYRIDITVKMPDSVAAIWYEQAVHGTYSTPILAPLGFNRLIVAKIEDLFGHIPLHVLPGRPYSSHFEDRSLKAKFQEIVHGDKSPLHGMMLTFISWEAIGRFTLPISIRTVQPPDDKEFFIPMEAVVLP